MDPTKEAPTHSSILLDSMLQAQVCSSIYRRPILYSPSLAKRSMQPGSLTKFHHSSYGSTRRASIQESTTC